MKKKLLIVFSLLAGMSTIIMSEANAQRRSSGTSYHTAIGLGVDFGDGGTFAGPSLKHFFTPNNVGKAEVLFGDNSTQLSLYYQYHGDVQNAAGLKWTLGLGGSVYFNKYFKDGFAFRPTAGLDYKIPNVPLSFEFDWRPSFLVTPSTDFNAARFGFGFRYCL